MIIRENVAVWIDQLHFECRGCQAIHRGRTARKSIERHLERVTESRVVDHLHDAGSRAEGGCVVSDLDGHVLDWIGVQAPHGIPGQDVWSGGVKGETSRNRER